MELYNYKAQVIKVTDGDTIDVDLDLGFNIHYKATLRFMNIDTPEVNFYKDRYVYIEEIEIGRAIRDWLKALIEGKRILVKSKKIDPSIYGRFDALVYYVDTNGNEVDLIQKMLDLGFDKTVVREGIVKKLAEGGTV
jgi:micrococcal nuclease